MGSFVESLESRQHLSASPHLVPSTTQVVFQQVQGTLSAPQTVSLKNTGSKRLTIKSITLDGADAGAFVIGNVGKKFSLSRGASLKFNVSYLPFTAALRGATISVTTNDPISPVTTIFLRGLGTTGLYGANEPSLQRVLDTLQIGTNVGDQDPNTTILEGPIASDEVSMPLLKKAGTGPVLITPLAMETFNLEPVAVLGWYTHNGPIVAHPLFSVPMGYGQSIQPPAYGTTQFDPGASAFGIFGNWPNETHGASYSEDALNPWNANVPNHQSVRFYTYRTASGQIIPNTYVVALEQGAQIDFQDAVLLIQNVVPAF
jgi:hypothetical protein